MVLAVVVSWGCSADSGEELTTKSADVPDEVIHRFTAQESDSGMVKWKLTAPLANKYTEKKTFVMDKPTIEFFKDDGTLQTTLTSENGRYFEETRDMLAYGNVVVVTVEGDVLETDSLRYLNTEDKIVSDSFVKLTRGNNVITGIGMECDHNLSSVDIKRNVKAQIVDEEGQFNG